MFRFPHRFFAALVLASGPIAVGTASAADAAKEKPPRLDLFGDPLPPGAVARLGTMRLRYAACMAFSPDGKIVATAHHHSVHLWDAATGKLLRRLTTPISSRWAFTIAFSPDGRKVAVMDIGAHRIVIWQLEKDKPSISTQVEERTSSHQMEMAKIVFSPDSKTLCTCDEQTIHVWDAATGKESKCLAYDGSQTYAFAFSGDGKLLATAGSSKSLIRLWDARTGKLLHLLRGHRRRVRCVAFSPDKRLLASGDDDRTVRLWDVESGKEIRNWQAHEGEIVALAFAPDGKVLATANREHSSRAEEIRLWDVKAGLEMPQKTISAPGVKALEYSPDGKTLAWIGSEESLHLLDATTGQTRVSFDMHHGDVKSVAYSPKDRLIATASFDHTIRLWDADTGKPKGVLRGHTNAVNAVAFSPDGKWLASGSDDLSAILWDVQARKMRFRCGDHDARVRFVAFTPDGRALLIGGYHWQFWDVRTGKKLPNNRENRKSISALALSPNGTFLAVGEYYAARVYDTRANRLLRTVETASWIASATFSPDGRTLACGCMEWTILWELASGKERARLPGDWNRRGTLAYSPDGKLLACGSPEPGVNTNKVVHVWELATGKEIGAFQGHERPIFGVAFSPDGKRLATASGDATVLIWDLAAVAARGPHPRVDKRSLKSPLDAKDLEAAWNDLAGDDAVKAQQAVWMLAREPRQAAAFLGQRLRPADKPDSKRIAALIDDLDSDQFAAREQASAELSRLGTLAEPRLRKKHAEKISLEMRKRIELLLEKLDVLAPLSREELRQVRAIEALEQGGSPEARQVLRRLAEGAEGARLTREAKASLQRMVSSTALLGRIR